MTLSILRKLGQVMPVAFFVGAMAFAALSAAGATQPLLAAAYNCGSGPPGEQQDVWNSRGHGWLGYCRDWFGDALYYTGEDWGGTTLSWQTAHLRVWECGKLVYDNTYTKYNSASISLNSGWWLTPCAFQSDSSTGEGINGQFSWWWYLHF